MSNSVKTFLWRAVKEVLPKKLNLFNKKFMKDAACPICKRKEETVYHALWSRSAASDVWVDPTCHVKKWWCRETEFFSLWEDIINRLDKKEVEEGVVIFCRIWLRRKNYIFKQVFAKPK